MSINHPDNSKRNNQGDETPIYLTPDSTLQTTEESEKDKNNDPNQDDTLSVSRDDLRSTDVDQYAGSDRAGTSERKDNSSEEE
jgi:hypothetical protein